MKSHEIHASLDLGSTEIRILVTQRDPEEHAQLKIIGHGRTPSRGIKKGLVLDIEKTAADIKEAVKKAEKSASIPLSEVSLCLSGSALDCKKSSGVVRIQNQEVKSIDIQNAIASAGAIPLKDERTLLLNKALLYKVDEHSSTQNPIGQAGTRLEIQSLVFMASNAALKGIIRACERASLEISHILPQALCSANYSLTDEEKNRGAVYIDLGFESTKLCSFKNGTLNHFSTLPVGSSFINQDLAIVLNTSFDESTRILKRFDLNWSQQKNDQLKLCSQVIEARTEELFALIQRSLSSCKLTPQLNAGIIWTGGLFQSKAFCQLAEYNFNLKSRFEERALNNSYFHNFSLSDWIMNHSHKNNKNDHFKKLLTPVSRAGAGIKEWFENFF